MRAVFPRADGCRFTSRLRTARTARSGVSMAPKHCRPTVTAPDLSQRAGIGRNHLVRHHGHARSEGDARSMRALAQASVSRRAAPKHPAIGRCPVVTQSSPDPSSQHRWESGVGESRHRGAGGTVYDCRVQAGQRVRRPHLIEPHIPTSVPAFVATRSPRPFRFSRHVGCLIQFSGDI